MQEEIKYLFKMNSDPLEGRDFQIEIYFNEPEKLVWKM